MALAELIFDMGSNRRDMEGHVFLSFLIVTYVLL